MESSIKLDVSCIILNYNSSSYTLDCVNSIIENTKDDISFEIVIIDNNSKKEDYLQLKSNIDVLQKEKNNIKFSRSKINTGFGGGNMLGVQLASESKFYAFINNDTLINSPNCLAILKEFMDTNPNVGLCGPQMLDKNKKPIISIGHFASPLTQIIKASFFEKVLPNKFVNRRKVYNSPTRVDYIQGAFMFVNSNDFNKIGGFDTNLFLYYEESDICLRLLKKLQKQTFLIPNANYIHFIGQSTSKSKRKTLIKAEQKISLLYYIRKHFSFFEYKFLQFFLTLKYLLSSFVKPANWKIFFLFLQGAPLCKSLKQKQQLKTLS